MKRADKPRNRLPAEWEPQIGVMLTWPHEQTDWQWILAQAETNFTEIAFQIARREQVFIACNNKIHQQHIQQLLQQRQVDLQQVRFAIASSNDSWARDHGPITVMSEGRPDMLDFGFDGWGGKYPAQLDNQITHHLHRHGLFDGYALHRVELILEGGSIESDGNGTLLTTRHCLFDGLRNQGIDRNEIELRIRQLLGIDRILCLDHGYMAGDDTDGHIDTLARFCDAHTIAYVSCNDPDDEHYVELKAMEEQLATFVTCDNQPYQLVPLPMPQAIYAQDGQRLPATHANFLILNEAVLVPTYNSPEADRIALERLASCFPEREIIGIDCSTLIQQYGSLHCVTMQIPAAQSA